MLDIRWIRDNPQALVAALEKRQWSSQDAQATVDDILDRDEARRAHLGELQVKQERRNTASKEIGNAMRSGDMALAEQLKAEVADIKTFIQGGEARERELDEALDGALAVLPNVPLDDVPVGADEHGNVETRRYGDALIEARRPGMGNRPKEHFEIGEALGLMDFERAARLSGARFTVLKGELARLERALGQFMLDLHTMEHGYTEVQPPLLVKDHVLFGTGQLPKFEEDLFKAQSEYERVVSKIFSFAMSTKALATGHERMQKMIDIEKNVISSKKEKGVLLDEDIMRFISLSNEFYEQNTDVLKAISILDSLKKDLSERIGNQQDSRWLIPTAEVPLTNLVREEILKHEQLPLRFTALTPCFRSEAGSAGRDTRGMLRQHQFYKVELVSITDQGSSLAEHERMTECAETVLKRLELPFRTMTLCTGDMGFGSRKTYDIEVWLPGQNAYREISSCSVCGDFQARRMDARYRPKDEKQTRFVHTLNGSGVAVGRALIAVIENYQNSDGSVTIPEALRPYMAGKDRIGG